MTIETKELQVQEAEEQEVAGTGDAEYSRNRRVYVPRVDIYESADDIVIVADMPGVDESSVDITLEKNVLTINGQVEPEQSENYRLAYAEYEVGDYRRTFTLSNRIDQENIKATVKNGVLRLWLGKVGPAKAKKITVDAG
jgi:HSP20 family molecular chaperone IbpA